MKTTLRYEFDDTSFFPKNFLGRRSVTITDPLMVPATGDKVHIRMQEFFDDQELLANWEEYTEGLVYFAERQNIIVGKKSSEVVIVLYEESVFHTLFPQFFAAELSA